MLRKTTVLLIAAALVFGLVAPAAAAPASGARSDSRVYRLVEGQIEAQLRQQLGRLFSSEIISQLARRLTEQIMAQVQAPSGSRPDKPPTPPATPAEPERQPEPERLPQPTPGELATEEARLFALTNQARAEAGVPALQLDSRLLATARAKSADMVTGGYFGHISPTLGSPFDQLSRAGITYRLAGENLAGAPTAARAHEGLMNSPGHKANILNPNFTHVGIGLAVGSPYGIIFTQQFTG